MHGGAVALAPQLHADGDAAVLDEREGMRRIDGDRRQDRQVLGVNCWSSHSRSAGRSSLGSTMWMPAVGHFGPQRVQQACWSLTRLAAKRLISASCWAGVRPSWLSCATPGGDLAVEAGHPHHVELVEVGGGDRQEAQALEQRVAEVVRLLQHAAIELQPGQLAIEEARRTRRRRRRRAGASACLHAFLQSRLGALMDDLR